jgi:hypothetical protein
MPMAERARKVSQDLTARAFDDRADTAEMNSETLRNFLVRVATPEMEDDRAMESI